MFASSRNLALLILVNAVLLVALATTTLGTPQPAHAQGLGGRYSFTMIPGLATGRTDQAVIYILDANSGKMVSLFFNSNSNQFEPLSTRNVAEDIASGG